MKKRIVIAFSLVMVLYFSVAARIYKVMFVDEQVINNISSKTLKAAEVRGTIYDCNLNELTNEKSEYYAAVKPTVEVYSKLGRILTKENMKIAEEKIKSGTPFLIPCKNIDTDSRDIAVLQCPVRYSGIATHIIGYVDSSGEGVTGIEKAFNGILTNAKYTVSARFKTDAKGNVLLGDDIEIDVSGKNKSGVVLTIDKEIQIAAETALDRFNIERGAAVVIDIKNGAIRACVSRPDFDQTNVADILDSEASPLINRAFLPFAVGSVFKPLVAAAALENGISENFSYECTGNAKYSGVIFNCHNKNGHGVIDMQEAVAHSCNTYFIALAMKTGAESIISTAEKFGFGKSSELCVGMNVLSGNLPDATELDSSAALANIAFGQGSLTATPVQLCSFYAAIADNGAYKEPYLIEGETDRNGVFVPANLQKNSKIVISEATAKRIRAFLENAVTNGSGKRAKPTLTTAAGKTATAQTGFKHEDGTDVCNVWYVGYFPADEPRYAMAVLKENGDSGSSDCAPVFAFVADEICSAKGIS